MKSRLFPVLLLLAATPACLLVGCGANGVVQQAQNAADRDALARHLKEAGVAFVNYHDTHWQDSTKEGAPESWEHLQEAGLSSEARQSLEAAGYKLVLGVEFRKATIGVSNFMIAYPANPPAGSPFLVGMMDGSVRNVDQSEFNELLTMQQPLLDQAVIVEPSAAAASAPSSSSSSAPSPYVPPPPPSSN